LDESFDFNPTVPAHVPIDRVVDFDMYHDPDFASDPHDVLKNARKSGSIIYSRYGSHWIVFGRLEAERVMSDPLTFSSDKQSLRRGGLITETKFIPQELDPPDHAKYRLLVFKHFGQKQVNAMEPFVRMWAERLIDPLVDRRTCDFASEVAIPMPLSIFMEIMGLPLERFDEFRALAVASQSADATPQERVSSGRRINDILAELIELRRRQPQDDVITKLLQEQFEGRPLNFGELLSICQLLFVAGLDTVANAMAFGMRRLAEDVELQAGLRMRPETIPVVAEDLLRRYAFVSPQRFVTQDVDVAGVRMRAGDRVRVILWSAANPEDAGNVPGTQQLAFGFGPHICLGMYLARLELRVMYETWFSRIGDFSLAGRPRMHGGSVIGMTSLPLALSPHINPGVRTSAA
jgi:cytochrome P450